MVLSKDRPIITFVFAFIDVYKSCYRSMTADMIDIYGCVWYDFEK